VIDVPLAQISEDFARSFERAMGFKPALHPGVAMVGFPDLDSCRAWP